jgi:hypothetical protein
LAQVWVEWQQLPDWQRRDTQFEYLKPAIATVENAELCGSIDIHLIPVHRFSRFLPSIVISFSVPVMS